MGTLRGLLKPPRPLSVAEISPLLRDGLPPPRRARNAMAIPGAPAFTDAAFHRLPRSGSAARP